MNIEVVSFTGDSGLADYAVSLARALARSTKARKSTVVTARSLPERFNSMGFAVERVFRRSRHYPVDILRFFFGVLRRRPDWVLLQGPLKFPLVDALVVRMLSLFGIRLGVTVHDVLPHYPRAWSKAEYGFYYRSFSRVVVHSEAARAGVRALGIKGDILTVPHGIYDIFDLTGIAKQVARQKVGNLQASDFVVLFFGHLEPRKGLMEFIQAAEILKDRRDIKFALAGGNSLGGHGPMYVERLEAARSMPNVIVHDRRIAFEDVENYFAACDVVALPYLEGTTSGILKLALAFGKPVVATRVGDFPEQVPAGGGLIIDNDGGIPASLCNALETIMSDYQAYSSAMAAAGQHAQWPDIADRLLAYIETN